MLSHQDRALIKDVNVSSGLRFGGPRGFLQTRVISFFVGDLGPFTFTLDYPDYNPANIEAAYEAEVKTLRAAGALDAAK